MEIANTSKKQFTQNLLQWHATMNRRSLPWKNEKDPYKIWLSEIILQQTRAAQATPYYLRFTDAYPAIHDMAAAGDEQVFRLWQGLGYYNRCKNMLATARHIARQLNGQFPTSYEGLLALKGIGPYTAAAIASFAFGLPCAVVDGNVYRVLARYFGIDVPFDTAEGKKIFSALAQQLLAPDSAGYNQSIMDLGATICTPKKPQCDECPLQKKCFAYNKNLVNALPVRSKKQLVRTRYFNYFLLKYKNSIWVHKRTEKDIWENLYEPYLIESSEQLTKKSLINIPELKKTGLMHEDIKYITRSAQRLSHQVINANFFIINLSKKIKIDHTSGQWMPVSELQNVAFPKTVVSFLENYLYF